MNKRFNVLLYILLLTSTVSAQIPDKFTIGVSTGMASGWWIYTLGTGVGIDRTDNEPKLSFEAELVYKPRRFGIGVGLGYSFLTDNTMEAFEDIPSQRRKYFIADKSVKFWQYYLQGEYDIFSGSKYTLSPQIRAGSFIIDTIHPEKDNFDANFLLEFSVVNQIELAGNLDLMIRPFYQVLMISVKQEMFPGEKHRIFSLGLALGLRYRI